VIAVFSMAQRFCTSLSGWQIETAGHSQYTTGFRLSALQAEKRTQMIQK